MDDESNPHNSRDPGSVAPILPSKPSLAEWLGSLLPFKIPHISLPQTAKNLDKSAARLGRVIA